MRHSDDLHPLLAVHELRVDFFQSVQVFEGRNGIREIHAVLAKVFGGFAIVTYCTRRFVPDIGSDGNNLLPIFGMPVP